MRKSTMKKGMSVLLTAAMAATMLAGCGDKDAETTTPPADDANPPADDVNDTPDDTTTADAPEENTPSADYTDYSAGFPERVTIQIPVYDRSFEGWNVTDNYYTKWVQTEFGDKYNVDVKYVAINRGDEVQDYMQLIAAGNAPDIIMHYDMPQAVNYDGEGAMQAIDLDELAFYAPNYYAKMGDTIAKYGTLNGETKFIFAERKAIYYNWVTLIRQDWLDQVGLAMPTNREELVAVGEAWKEAGLGTLGESLKKNAFTMEYPFFTDSIATEEYAKYLDLNVAPFTWKPTEDYLRALNAEYNAGIIDPEFYMKEDDAAIKADFVAGKTGTYAFYINSSTDVISSLLANQPDAKVAVMDLGAGSPTGNGYYYEYPPYGMIMGINSKSTDEQRAAVFMFLEWMSDSDNLMFLQNGPEGEAYNMENGLPIAVADYAGEAKRSQNNNKDYWCLVQEIIDYGDDDLTYQANLLNLAPAGYEDLIKSAYDMAKAEEPYGIVTPIFTKAVASTQEYSADLNAMWQQFYVDCVTCKPEEFDAKYADYCQQYLDGGYQAILDEKQALWDEGSYIAD